MTNRINDIRDIAEKVYVANVNGENLKFEVNNLLLEVRDGNKGYQSIMTEFPGVVYLTENWKDVYDVCMDNLKKALDEYLI